MKVSIQTIAELAGVSTATVSRVFHGDSYVKEETRRLIERIAEENGYKPRGYNKRQTARSDDMLIGVAVADITNPFFTTIIRHIIDFFEQHDIECILCDLNENPNREIRYLSMLKQKNISGIIISPTSESAEYNAAFLKELYASGLPIILLDRDIKGIGLNGVFQNNQDGAYVAVDTLIREGHQKIAFIAGPMVFLPLAAMPILIGLGLFLQTAARRCAEQSYKQNMQKNALLVEMVNGLETIKACQAESRMQRLWEAVVGLSAKSTAESRRYSSLAVTASTLVTHMVTVSMIIWGVYRISEGLMTMGALIGCNILVGRAMAPLMQLASLLTRLQNSRVALQALDLLMELPSENQSESSCMDFGELQPSFTVENVSFAYPNSMRLALEDVSLRINPGDRIGIIGAMGSGKSTLAKLLTGFYQPQKGSIKFGDVDLRQLPTTELRGRIGVLPQDVVLFYGSIRENIVLGDPTINDHLVFRAAALAGVTDFVRNNPAGFAAQVGEQGKALSGGQRQAVALARALVRDPEVLILDEPTSNMDTDSEQRLQQRLAAVSQGRTLILVTHRLSMLRMVNKLAVMENGRLRMFGPRDAILKRLRDSAAAARKPAPEKGQGAPAGAAAVKEGKDGRP